MGAGMELTFLNMQVDIPGGNETAEPYPDVIELDIGAHLASFR